MTEAEKIAARAKIFTSLGLAPDGMCKTTTFPILSNIEANQDAACREILSESELEACAAHEVSLSVFLVARGVVKPASTEPASNYDPTEDIRECLAKYSAGVGPNPRNHLFLAAALINRALKR